MAVTRRVAKEKLSRAQKKALGILPRQVLRGVVKGIKNGDYEKDMTARELTFAYAADAMDAPATSSAWRNAKSGKVGAPDWDNILEFLEKLMELILKFLPMFL